MVIMENLRNTWHLIMPQVHLEFSVQNPHQKRLCSNGQTLGSRKNMCVV